MNGFEIETKLIVPEVNVRTCPQGPRGVGIRNITQNGNVLTVTYDDGSTQDLTFPAWWFGTLEEYYSMSEDEKKNHYIHFIEE